MTPLMKEEITRLLTLDRINTDNVLELHAMVRNMVQQRLAQEASVEESRSLLEQFIRRLTS